MASSSNRSGVWFLYLIECRGGRVYAEISDDPLRCFAAHLAGQGGTFTRMNPPVSLIGCRVYPTRSMADRERTLLKKQRRDSKLSWARANYASDDLFEWMNEAASA